MAKKSQQNFDWQMRILMKNEFSNNPSNISHSIGRSLGLAVSKMLWVCQPHAKIYIHGNSVRTCDY